MARNPRWDTEKLSSHAPRPRAREPGASATTGRVEGSRTAAAADGDGPNLLGFPIEAVDELATFAADSAAGNVVGWHRRGFRRYWAWKSRRRSGRPMISTEL